MRKLFLILLLFLNIYTYSQFRVPNQISLGISYSPSISYRSISESNFKEILNEEQGITFGSITGINLRYNLNNQFDLESGLMFQKRGYRFKEVIFDEYTEDPAIPDNQKLFIRNWYLGIPFIVNYILSYKQLSLTPSIGIIANFSVFQNSKSIAIYGDQIIKEISEPTFYHRLTVTPTIGFGIDYKLSESIYLNIMPTFQHDIISYSKDSKSFLWDIGISISCRYLLKSNKS